jgi:tripartite-type tricarboxylate transporter receptor subunit TctC
MIRLIVPYVHAGGTDKRSRLLAGALADELGEPIEVENLTGAVAGHTAIARAAPDGTTLGMITGEIGMMHWHADVTELTWRDYTPLAVPFVEAAAVIVGADAPWHTLQSFLTAIRSAPLKGSGSPDFGVWKFALDGLLARCGIDRQHLHWLATTSGEEGIERVLEGKAAVAPVPMVEAPELIFEGRIRPLATMAETRHPLFPDVPTVREAIGLDWSVAHWRGLVAPAGLPPARRTRLIEALARVQASEAFTSACARAGYSLGWRLGDAFGQYMQEDDELFGRLITRPG